MKSFDPTLWSQWGNPRLVTAVKRLRSKNKLHSSGSKSLVSPKHQNLLEPIGTWNQVQVISDLQAGSIRSLINHRGSPSCQGSCSWMDEGILHMFGLGAATENYWNKGHQKKSWWNETKRNETNQKLKRVNSGANVHGKKEGIGDQD